MCATTDKAIVVQCSIKFASDKPRKIRMPRYVVERSFPDGLAIPMNDTGAGACNGVIARNAEKGVTWVQSYVSPDKKKTFCIYDGPSPKRSAVSLRRIPYPSIRSPKCACSILISTIDRGRQLSRDLSTLTGSDPHRTQSMRVDAPFGPVAMKRATI